MPRDPRAVWAKNCCYCFNEQLSREPRCLAPQRLMQALTKSSSCRGCTWVFVRVFLGGSRLQVRSLDVRVHTSHRGSNSEGGWNECQNEHPIVCRVESGPRFPCLRARDTQMHAIHLRTWRNGRLPQTLAGKDVNSFTPWDTSSTRLAGLFCFQEPLDRSL